jgi:GNAT superfamily N-acetyltransferase
MALTFRKAVPSERDDAERILRSAFTPYVRNLGREIAADAHAFLAAAIDRGDIYLAVDGAEVVGVAATERRDGGIYIDRLGVAPARQGTGLGSWLLVRIEEVARSIGARSLSLETAEMAEGNIRLYRRHGFEIVGRGLPAHGKDPHMRVHMVKPL